MMTLRAAQAECRDLGFTLRHDAARQEYSVYPIGGGDTYFTNDRDDAVATARAMAPQQAKRNQEIVDAFIKKYSKNETPEQEMRRLIAREIREQR